MHGVLKSKALAVRSVRQTEESLERVTRHVGVGPSREGLLDLLTEGHAVRQGGELSTYLQWELETGLDELTLLPR